jgi:hypothetical protein
MDLVHFSLLVAEDNAFSTLLLVEAASYVQW